VGHERVKLVAVPEPASEFPRVVAVDAFRGFMMALIASAGFGLAALDAKQPFGRVGGWMRHSPWKGCTLWDTIQPSFMFLAGLSLVLAMARRTAKGDTATDHARHLVIRSVKLIVVSQILIWIARNEVRPQLIDSLSQIAIASLIVVVILALPRPWQVVAGVALIGAHWGLHLAFPGPDGAWSGQLPIGMRIDQKLFRWSYYDGAYSTLNVLSSTLWPLAGAWVGQYLLARHAPRRTVRVLAGWAVVALVSGLALARWVPMVKALATPSFVVIGLGWSLAFMTVAYALFDVVGLRRLAWPLVIIGRNSIVVYALDVALRGWLQSSVFVFTRGYPPLGRFGVVADLLTVGLVIWLLCLWLHRRNIVVKL
jgi:heparan-alpha-glucosaminide N-acetyltransferase